MVFIKCSLIAIVIGELRLAAIVEFPTVFQYMGLVGSKEPFANFLTAVNIEVSVGFIHHSFEILGARVLVVSIRRAQLQTERETIAHIHVVHIVVLSGVLGGVGCACSCVSWLGAVPLASIGRA